MNFLVGKITDPCSKDPECKNPPQVTVKYGTSGTAAVLLVNGGISTHYVFASEISIGQPQKNLGGCQKRCTAGLGSDQDGTGPRGSRDSAASANAANPGSPFEGDPINTTTGNFYRQETDFESPTGLRFRRFYNSSNRVAGSRLGEQWRHLYDRKLEILRSTTGVSGDGQFIEAMRPDGGSERFTLGSNGWQGATDVADVLVEREAGAGYALQLSANRQTELYDATGLLQEVYDQAGKKLYSFQYSTAETLPETAPLAGLLLTVTDAYGRSLVFSYDGASRLIKVVLPDGGELQYSYDATGYLASVSYPDGTAVGYLYNETAATGGTNLPGVLTGIVDERGIRYETIKYKSNRSAYNSYFAGGVDTTTIDYAAATQNYVLPASVTGPLGATTNLKFIDVAKGRILPAGGSAPCGNQCNQPWKSMAYDVNGYPATATDFKGNINRTTFTIDGLLSQQINASDTAQQRTINIAWNAELRVPLTRVVLDVAGMTIARVAWRYNARGQQIARCEIDPAIPAAVSYTCGSVANAPAGVRQWRTSYCDAVDETQCPQVGLVLSQDGPRTDVGDGTTYRYYLTTDESGCASVGGTCHRAGDLYQVLDALGRAVTYVAYDQNGRLTRAQDANGLIRDIAYTPRGWAASSTLRANADGAPSNQDQTVLVAYDAVGDVSRVTDPDGTFVAYGYDDARRLTDVSDGAGNTIHYTLDVAGNRVKEETKDVSGALKHTLSRIYNKLGQLATQATAKADPTDFAYDANGNLQLVTDALKRKTQVDYDPLDRVKRTLQDVGGIAVQTQFEYDVLDRMTKIIDPKGLATTYQYNGVGDLLSLTSPDTGTTSFTYDNAGNRIAQTDARGTTTSYTYDALGRLAKTAYADSALVATYIYDMSQSVCTSGETFALGRLSMVQDGGGQTQYCYDRFGRVARKVQTTNGKEFAVRYAYTKGGRLSQVTYPDGAVVDYQRNTLGQTTEIGVTAAGGTRQKLLGGTTYYPFGPSAGWSYGNGRPLQRVLDQDYRPLAIQDSRSDGLNVGFSFDSVSNLTALTAPGSTAPEVTLSYDTLGRLTAFKDGATGTVIDSYSYDATGNRLSAQVNGNSQAYAYPTDSHRLAGVANASRSYDAAGNTTAIDDAAREFVYDATGRLSEAKRSGTLAMEYRYNARGEQVRRFLGTTSTYTLYDEDGHWLGDYNTASKAVQQVIWLDDLPVGVLAGNTLNYVQPDHLGAPRAVIDSVRDVAIWKWNIKGEAFGNTAPDQDPDRDGASFVFDMRFPGQRYDSTTGLNQNYYRDYDSISGRYVQSDPIGLNGGLSTYAYTGANPIGLVDPFGLSSLVYSRPAGMLYVYNGAGGLAGQYSAANNATLASRGPWAEGTYSFSYFVPHSGGPDSPYGSNGNNVFNVPGCKGCGVHAGRQNSTDRRGRSGVNYATEGCIRTTDQATALIRELTNAGDPLTTLTVTDSLVMYSRSFDPALEAVPLLGVFP